MKYADPLTPLFNKHHVETAIEGLMQMNREKAINIILASTPVNIFVLFFNASDEYCKELILSMNRAQRTVLLDKLGYESIGDFLNYILGR